MKRYTISEIKRASAETSPHFFDRDTLRHFGQSMGSFKVRHVGGRVFIFAPVKYDGRQFSYTFREFIPETGELELIRVGNDWPDFKTLCDCERFLDSVKAGGAA